MIRKIKTQDFFKIYELGLSYDNKFKNHYNLDLYLDSQINNILVFEENDIIKGFIIYKIIDDFIDVELILVDKKYQNGKIGTKLMEEIEKENISFINLEVSKENVIAKKLYDNLGYKEIFVRRGYYNGVDAILMKKVIKWKMYTF